MTAELSVRAVDNTTPKYVLWPKSSPLPKGAIQEVNDYFFDLEDQEAPLRIEKSNLYIDGQPLEALRSPSPGVARWRWSPGFHAGKIQISIEIPGRKSNTVEVVTDPNLEKLTRDDFTVMVRDILHDTKALFSLSGFRTGISKGDGGSVPPIARLEFLRSRFLGIEETVKEICARPVRVLSPQDVVMPIHKVKQIRPNEYIKSLRHGHILETTPKGRIAVRYLPHKVQKTKKVSGVDIREHRDIKNRLKTWQVMLKVFGDRLHGNSGWDKENTKQERVWAKRCDVMSRRLGNLLSHPFFSEVGDHSQPVVMTSIYRNVPTYRRFFHLHRDIESGISNILGDYLDLPLARTFDLYELWTFLRLIRAAIQLYGLKIAPQSLFRLSDKPGSINLTPENVVVDLNNGFGLVFKKQFREYWLQADGVGSYSRTMEPDISVVQTKTGEVSSKLIVLDAKYRIDSGLNDAISSIHTYRDAIVDGADGNPSAVVVGAYLLSPHKPFWGGAWMNTKMPGRLFHPRYRDQFKFGAVSLYPGMPMGDVCLCLETMIDDANS